MPALMVLTFSKGMPSMEKKDNRDNFQRVINVMKKIRE